tara:strand:- start:2827 stop:3453 length:627 start_codon:yes stop_codon:yes gene_type:complete
MKKVNLKDYTNKLKILERIKRIVTSEGWSKNITKKIINKNINSKELAYYFPNGYIDMLKFSLVEINHLLEEKISKINLIKLPLNKRIKKILMKRLEILNEENKFYKKTFYHLLMPQNSKILKKSLYRSVDMMWYLAGDNSTDFNFYTKRITLAGIYVSAIFILFSKNIDEAEINIDKNLERISKLPKIKERFSFIKDNLPIFFKSLFN